MLKNYDMKTNTFTLPNIEVKLEQKKSRGFIVTVADSKDEADAMQRGEVSKFSISPVLAPNEQVAIDYIQGLGKIAISIVPLELLEMQVSLLHELAKNQNINLLREDLFKVQIN